jgi:prepilin-type N-terminal cleavage/methylation domain-containing protein
MRSGFTLMELLVVLVIVALLAGLLFPVLGRARARAQEAPCTSQLRQIGQAFSMYRDDHGFRPPLLSDLYPVYVTSKDLFVCPLDEWTDGGGWFWSTWGPMAEGDRGPFAQTYGYFFGRDPTGPDAVWHAVKASPGNPGYSVCVLHGERWEGRGYRGVPLAVFGVHLRLGFDGSVTRRQYRREPFNTFYVLADRLPEWWPEDE